MNPKKRLKHIAGQTLKAAYEPFAILTARKRALPDFIIIGAARAGSTHLFHTLKSHPQVHTGRVKELHFFDKDENYNRGEMYYRSRFPLTRNIKPGHVVIEATPKYVYDKNTPLRLKTVVPDAKLILLLRNPTERTISNYFHNVSRGYEKRSLKEIFLDNNNFSDEEIVARSLYVEQLERYSDYIKQKKILLLKSEDLFHHREETLNKVCNYMDIEENNFSKKEVTHHAVPRTENKDMDRVKEILDDYFAPFNDNLNQRWDFDIYWR